MENIELAVITNIIDASDRTFGFAKLASTGEQAYVGPNIFRQKSLELGATIYCDIAQNDSRYTDRGCNKRIIFVYDEDGPFAHLLPKAVAKPVVQVAPVEEEKPKGPTSSEIFEALSERMKDCDSFYTTAEITACMSLHFDWEMDSGDIGRDLQRLHDTGAVAKLTLDRVGGMKRASRVAWGASGTSLSMFDSWFDDDDGMQ